MPAPAPLAGVIAVVGCDGAGKSTLSEDLVAALRRDRPTEFIYLGQSSGDILDWILGVPVVGRGVGAFLVRRSERAHGKAQKSASPDLATALVIHLLSRWRHHKFGRMLAASRRGTVVVVDRYPQAEAQGFYFDGPGLPLRQEGSAAVRWLARRELRLYQAMAAKLPLLLIRLNIDAETAHARKPDHGLPMLEAKTRVIPTLRFNGATILDLDSREPYAKVLDEAMSATRTALGLPRT